MTGDEFRKRRQMADFVKTKGVTKCDPAAARGSEPDLPRLSRRTSVHRTMVASVVRASAEGPPLDAKGKAAVIGRHHRKPSFAAKWKDR